MSLIRCLSMWRNIKQVMCTPQNTQSIASRLSHVWSYRTACPPHSKGVNIGAEVASAAMWWWIFWHLWHESEHITGEFYYPDPNAWTNEELGIPADDVE